MTVYMTLSDVKAHLRGYTRLPTEARLSSSSSTFRYYFYGQGGNVTAVLKSANLVDIDDVLAQVNQSQSQVVSSITGQYTFRWVRSNTHISCKLPCI